MTRTSISITALALLAAAPTVAQRVTLTAVETDTIAENDDDAWNDNRLRAYWDPSAPEGHVDGFIKFDLSTLADDADIVGLTLRTYHELGFNNPYQDPTVRVYRSSDDTWANLADDDYPGLNELLTPPHQGSFPVGDLVPYDWPLDVAAADWSKDLLDDTLTLALQADGTLLCYVYFYGANAPTAPPELLVDIAGPIGDVYCTPAVPNSTGLPGVMEAFGLDVAGGHELTLAAHQLPPGRFGYLLTGQEMATIPDYQGSQGTLCLGAPFGGFTKQVQKVDLAGDMSVDVDTLNMPLQPPVPVLSGETWFFQFWYRDVNPGYTSNFTDAYGIHFH